MMFEHCIIKKGKCPMCGTDNQGASRCGQARGNNHINQMKECPLDEERKIKHSWRVRKTVR